MVIYKFIKFSFPQFFFHDLWRGNPFVPIFRLIFLQIYFALGFKRYNYIWLNDLLLPIEKGETGLTGNYYFGLHEFNDMSFVLHLLRESDLFIDVGANLGSYSLLASGINRANTLAFEPVPKTFQRLEENIQLNNLENKVVLKRLALTSPEKRANNNELFFSIDKDTENSFVYYEYPGKKLSIPVSTLEKECEGLRPTLIKIDVEGYELEVLNGAIRLLSGESLLGLILEGGSSDINSLLEKCGFIQVAYNGLNRQLTKPLKANANQIWIKNIKAPEIQKLLMSSTKINFLGKSF